MNEPPKTPADLANAHLVHYKSFVCWILDPAQPPCFQGEYNPRKISAELLRNLRTHKLFNSFCHVEMEGQQAILWIKENFQSQYHIWSAKNAQNNAQRALALEENSRVRDAIKAYFDYQQKRRNYKCTIHSAQAMVMAMLEEYELLGADSCFITTLKEIGYIK